MKKTIAAVALALGMGTAPALAEDLILPDAPTPTGGYAWDGFYAGVVGGFWNGNSFYLLGGGSIGGNFALSNGFVLGVEGRGLLYSDGDVGLDGSARFGASFDNVLLYTNAGLGLRDGAGHVFVGAGAELAVMDNMSLDGRLEFVTGAGFNAIRGTAGLNFHF